MDSDKIKYALVVVSSVEKTAGGKAKAIKALKKGIRTKLIEKEIELAVNARKPGVLVNLPMWAKAPLLLGGLSASIVGASSLGNFIGEKERQNAYAAMIKANPELEKSKNKMEVLQLFNSLWDMNSAVAKNPLTAGTFIKDQLALGMGMPAQTALALLKESPKYKDKDHKSLAAVKEETNKALTGGLVKSIADMIAFS